MNDWGRRESTGERIEIQLTPNDSRAKPTPPTSPPDPPASESGNQTSDESDGGQRRTLLVTAAAVGVVALVLGWALGRGSAGDDGAASATATASTIAVTTTERITDTVAPPATTSTTRPSTSTTTTLPPGTPVRLQLPPEVSGLPYELAVSDYSGSVYRVDLSEATLRTYDDGRDQPPTIAFRPDGSVLTYSPWGDGVASAMIALDGTTTRLDAGSRDQLVVDGDGGLWRYRYDTRSIELLDDNMEPVGTSLTLTPIMQARSDPAGGVLIAGSNGTFSVDASGVAARLSAGDVVAAGSNTLIAHECAEDMACGYVVVDRASGTKTTIDLDAIVAAAPQLADTPLTLTRQIVPPGWFGSDTSAAVVGRFAVIGVESQGASQIGYISNVVVDLDRLQVTAHLEVSSGEGITMSDDGVWGFAPATDGVIIAIELATGRQIQFHVGSAAIFDIAIRST